MPKGVRLKPEQAVAKLGEIEVKLSQVDQVAEGLDKGNEAWRGTRRGGAVRLRERARNGAAEFPE